MATDHDLGKIEQEIRDTEAEMLELWSEDAARNADVAAIHLNDADLAARFDLVRDGTRVRAQARRHFLAVDRAERTIGQLRQMAEQPDAVPEVVSAARMTVAKGHLFDKPSLADALFDPVKAAVDDRAETVRRRPWINRNR